MLLPAMKLSWEAVILISRLHIWKMDWVDDRIGSALWYWFVLFALNTLQIRHLLALSVGVDAET